MKKRYYKQLSAAGELKGVSQTCAGLSGAVYAISRREYLLSLCALSLAAGILPADGIFAETEDVI